VGPDLVKSLIRLAQLRRLKHSGHRTGSVAERAQGRV